MSLNWPLAGSSERTMCTAGGMTGFWILYIPWELASLSCPSADWVCSIGLSKQCQPNAHAPYYCLLILTVANLGIFL